MHCLPPPASPSRSCYPVPLGLHWLFVTTGTIKRDMMYYRLGGEEGVHDFPSYLISQTLFACVCKERRALHGYHF
jgi:hypothetical protein